MWLQGDPLDAAQLRRNVNIGEFACAICLCDRLWLDPDGDSSNGIDFLEEKDMLRLDSMLLLVQLHIRQALQSRVRVQGCH